MKYINNIQSKLRVIYSRIGIVTFAVAVSMVVTITTANAQTQMVLVVDSNEFGGESEFSLNGRKGINVLAWSWGMSNSGTASFGFNNGRGKARIQNLNLTKYVDSASTAFMMSTVKGNPIEKATLYVNLEPNGLYITIELTNLLVTSFSTGGQETEGLLTENIALDFEKVKVTYYEKTSTGTGSNVTHTFSWDVVKNTDAI
jgi:type VI secretion system secreted protein Hcp